MVVPFASFPFCTFDVIDLVTISHSASLQITYNRTSVPNLIVNPFCIPESFNTNINTSFLTTL